MLGHFCPISFMKGRRVQDHICLSLSLNPRLNDLLNSRSSGMIIPALPLTISRMVGPLIIGSF